MNPSRATTTYSTAGPDESLGAPDWTLRMPRTFTLAAHRSLLHQAADEIEATHAHLRCWWDSDTNVTTWQGYYGDDKAACVAALSPLMHTFTEWRDTRADVSTQEG